MPPPVWKTAKFDAIETQSASVGMLSNRKCFWALASVESQDTLHVTKALFTSR